MRDDLFSWNTTKAPYASDAAQRQVRAVASFTVAVGQGSRWSGGVVHARKRSYQRRFHHEENGPAGTAAERSTATAAGGEPTCDYLPPSPVVCAAVVCSANGPAGDGELQGQSAGSSGDVQVQIGSRQFSLAALVLARAAINSLLFSCVGFFLRSAPSGTRLRSRGHRPPGSDCERTGAHRRAPKHAGHCSGRR